MPKITVECNCGTTYTVNEGEYLICPKCQHPPLLMWNANIRALVVIYTKINDTDKFSEVMSDHAGLWLLFGALLGKHFPQEILQNE